MLTGRIPLSPTRKGIGAAFPVLSGSSFETPLMRLLKMMTGDEPDSQDEGRT
jgi:hypothetical protein